MVHRGKHKEEAVGMEIIIPGDSLSTLKSPDNCHQVGFGMFNEDYNFLESGISNLLTVPGHPPAPQSSAQAP